MQLLGGGAMLAGLMLGAIAAFIIDRRVRQGGRSMPLAGAVLAFFGFIHGAQLALGGLADGRARLSAARRDMHRRRDARGEHSNQLREGGGRRDSGPSETGWRGAARRLPPARAQEV